MQYGEQPSPIWTQETLSVAVDDVHYKQNLQMVVVCSQSYSR